MLGAWLALGASPNAAKIERYRDGGWDLVIKHDRFANLTRCVLSSTDRRVDYQPGALGFQVGKRRDTRGAWYRVDGSAPVRWQDRIPVLVASGVVIDGPGLDNPSGGWVWIPIDEVREAQRIEIRAADRVRVREFRLQGFASLLNSARRLGCDVDDSFRS